MSYFVFRNNTVESFFPKGYVFSGYDDISVIPENASAYVWFYQAPLGFDQSALENTLRGYREKFSFVLGRIGPDKPFYVLTMEELYAVPFTEDDKRVRRAIGEYNDCLWDAGRTHTNVKVLDFSAFIRRYPNDETIDWKFYFFSQMGINPRIAKDFRVWWDRKLESVALKRKKCLVLDLDNTLWGGVLGEDGVSGIRMGGDYPGKAFRFFQEALLELSRTGVILAVCSKNNEADVLEAWEKNPYLVLRKEHFSAYRINWTDKASNLRELAEELNIGLDSFVFVDDNPAEREIVRQMLPMVSVPEFPRQPYELPLFFKKMVEDYFTVYAVTEEDRRKTEQYKANAARVRAQQAFTDFGSYLESLDIRMSLEEADDFNIPRIAQMTQKTNQFNLTTRRYTDSDIRRFLYEGWKIWCLRVSDRFGDSGITGCIFFDGTTIDTFLLSCRILGKGIETAFLKYALALLREQGVVSVEACYVPTAKNPQVSGFYERCGFSLMAEEPGGAKRYSLALQDADLKTDKYYHITSR